MRAPEIRFSTYQPVVFSNVTLVRPVQPSNAYEPIIVTLSGILILVRVLQPTKADEPILLTLSGIVTLTRILQSLNAPVPICEI